MRWDLAGNMLGAQPQQSPRGVLGGLPLMPQSATQSPINDITTMRPTTGMVLDDISGPSRDPWAAIAARSQPDEVRDPVITSPPALSPTREKLVQAVMNSTNKPMPLAQRQQPPSPVPQPQPQMQSLGVPPPPTGQPPGPPPFAPPPPPPQMAPPPFAPPPQQPRPQGHGHGYGRPFNPMMGGGFRQQRARAPRSFMRPMRPGG